MKRFSGKVMGGVLGFLAGGPVGAAAGFIIGHVHDLGREMGFDPWAVASRPDPSLAGTSAEATFTTGVIVLGAKMAKADGRVTRAEIDAFKRVFQVSPRQEAYVGKLFDKARMSASGFEPHAFQLAHVFKNNRQVLEEVLGGLFVIAASDTAGLSSAEILFLKRVAVIFDLGMEDFERIAARAGVRLPGGEKARDETQDAYAILGVKVTSSADEIKTSYRALIREHHPDRLMAQGMPASFVATAEEKMKRINVAYDTLCKIKGIK